MVLGSFSCHLRPDQGLSAGMQGLLQGPISAKLIGEKMMADVPSEYALLS